MVAKKNTTVKENTEKQKPVAVEEVNIENTVMETPNTLDEIVEVSDVASADTKSEIDRISAIGKICIRPFTDGRNENMGLEKYDMCLFPNTTHKEDIAAIEINGVVKFITGLDEFAPSVQNIKDPLQKKAEIKRIREVVAYLEKTLETNIIDIDDPNFWDKVKVVKPNNKTFWNSIIIECGNDPVYLYPMTNPMDMIKLMAIEAGGFSSIAPSYDHAMSMPQPPKFYLDMNKATVSAKTIVKRLKNKAIGLLDDISVKTPVKLLYILKLLDNGAVSYKKSTDADVIYSALDDYINGLGAEHNKEKACNRFIEIAEKTIGEVKLRAVIKEAMFYKIIAQKGDGMYCHISSGTMVGRNNAEIYNSLSNVGNSDIMRKVVEEVEERWS